MKYSEYKVFSEKYISKISNENLLFWNLWCLNFPFKHIDDNNLNPENKEVFFNLQKVYQDLWKLYQKDINIDSFLNNKIIDHFLNIDDDYFSDLDDFDTNEVAIRELISGLENIILDLKEDKTINYNASELPINLIDVIVDGISINEENNHEIFINEVNAQEKLAKELISSEKNYTILDKDIYRTI